MRPYETVFVLNPELGADAQTEQIEFYKDNITKNGGEIVNVDMWGKLSLAYKIERFNEGIYTVIQFNASTDYIDELERRYKYNENVLRYIVVQLDEKKFKAKPRKDPIKRERKPRRQDDQLSGMPDLEIMGEDGELIDTDDEKANDEI